MTVHSKVTLDVHTKIGDTIPCGVTTAVAVLIVVLDEKPSPGSKTNVLLFGSACMSSME